MLFFIKIYTKSDLYFLIISIKSEYFNKKTIQFSNAITLTSLTMPEKKNSSPK